MKAKILEPLKELILTQDFQAAEEIIYAKGQVHFWKDIFLLTQEGISEAPLTFEGSELVFGDLLSLSVVLWVCMDSSSVRL